MKPKLIYNWPNVKDEHDEVSRIIKGVIQDYTTKKALPMEGEEGFISSSSYISKPKSQQQVTNSIELQSFGQITDLNTSVFKSGHE